MTDAKIYHRPYVDSWTYPWILLRLTTITTLFLTHGARYIDILLIPHASDVMGYFPPTRCPDAPSNVDKRSTRVVQSFLHKRWSWSKRRTSRHCSRGQKQCLWSIFWETLRRNGSSLKRWDVFWSIYVFHRQVEDVTILGWMFHSLLT